jgi:uncharacterized protein (DUF362 family)
MVRKLFVMHHLDHGNLGSKRWSPLSELVSKGNTVILLPNIVSGESPLGELGLTCTVTHPSVLRPIVDYVMLALRGRGKVIICGTPMGSIDFDGMCKKTGLTTLVEFYASKVNSISVDLLDLRKIVLVRKGLLKRELAQKGDPSGYTAIDLGRLSSHSEISRHYKKYYIASYSLRNMRRNHTAVRHRYLFSNTMLDADVVIHVPKLKTHMKAGISVCLKSHVGASGVVNSLPHHRSGTPQSGGDEYPRAEPRLLLRRMVGLLLANGIGALYDKWFAPERAAQKRGREDRKLVVLGGNWCGNDTLWRTILDLNLIMKYAARTGLEAHVDWRKHLFIVDGIIGMEGNGPILGHPKQCGIMLLGTNACAVDYVATKLMGFEVKRLKQVNLAFKTAKEGQTHPLVDFGQNDITVHSNVQEYAEIDLLTRKKSLRFLAPDGWEPLYGKNEA